MDYAKKIGMSPGNLHELMDDEDAIRYINFKLVSMGLPCYEKVDNEFIGIIENHIRGCREKSRLLSDYLCPADRRIRNFLSNYLDDVKDLKDCPPSLPSNTFVLDQYGLARKLSLPPDKNIFKNKYTSTYRIKQGILHNPLHDRRTTEGSFHIVEGGLPVPPDKKEVPKITFARLLHKAVNAPGELQTLPFLSSQGEHAYAYVSLLLRPVVCPEVKGVIPEKTMEIRFFAPGSLVGNLDFIESIFGNAGDPNLSENDAGLDIDHWTGHTGCIILVPHLTGFTKRELGLPEFENATPRQRKDGMCWKREDELYNDGQPFKITCRDDKGVVVTLIADNYFGYSKKEIKTQISYAANLYGLAEEEHAGGAIAFPRKSHGEHFYGYSDMYTFDDVKEMFGDMMIIKPENYGIDVNFPNIYYIPENAEIHLYKQDIKWEYNGEEHHLKILPDCYFIHPSGYKIHMEKHPEAPAWRLIGTSAIGTFIHKPCTVSGGGKSEISKSLMNAIIYDNFFIHDMEKDFDFADRVINFDYKSRWKADPERTKPSRSLLSPERSLGSVIKLLTPSSLYTDEYNHFLESIPIHIKALVLFIKRFYVPEWGSDWRKHFSTNLINGKEGHALFYNGRKIMASYLRVGFNNDNSWYVHKLRTDFYAAAKIQMEDDISASVTLPASMLDNIDHEYKHESVKIVTNCEYRFFQRPDEAVHRGYDKEAEADLASSHNFISNYEPLTPENARDLVDNAIEFDLYTDPIKEVIKEGAVAPEGSYFISPSHPRLVDGKPTKNPRYLQSRPDFSQPIDYYLAEVGTRLRRRIPLEKPVYYPVNAVLPARRNNPIDRKKGIRPLSVYNPVHYQELPELFMDFICSLTGKSPSTTGAGSEGALTKGPFNMLNATTDLNNALLSFILTGYNGYTTAAGYIGSSGRIDHDISILVPELWSRFYESELDPKALISEGDLEKLDDFKYEGKMVLASRLGYRITDTFCFKFLGRVFDEPQSVFTKAMLRPEEDDMEAFVDGVNNIVEAQAKAALQYFEDNSVEAAIPPLRILLHVMAYGHFENKEIYDPEIRKMFTREYVLKSEWYHERLRKKQEIDIAFLERQISYVKEFIEDPKNNDVVSRMDLEARLKRAMERLRKAGSRQYPDSLTGTIGADLIFR